MVMDVNIAEALKQLNEKLQSLLDQLGDQGAFTFLEHSGVLTLNSMVLALILPGVMIGLAIFFYRNKKALDFCNQHTNYAFIAVWTLGFVVYDLGMYPDHSASAGNAFWAMLGVAPMAIIHAFEMFILQSDVSAIHEGCHNSAWFMFFFSIAHLLAAFISMVFVIKHFGFIITSFIRMSWKSNVKELFVFWGMNDATYYLAKDIANQKNNRDARIIIIRLSKKEDPNKRIGWDRLFSFLSLSNNNLDNLLELQKLGCMTASTFVSYIDLNASSNNDLIKSELRLSSLVKLMNHTTEKVHMFFLDDDESFNIQAVGKLKQDISINEYVKSRRVKFYYRTRYRSIHRVMEDEPTHKNIEFQVIDSSHLSVEMLKLKENIHLQPVSYVTVEKDATVSTPFNALVIGFSEVGMDMVRFLYEFGAFVKNDGTNKKVSRSDFHCDVVDKRMASLAGLFIASTPAIKPRLHIESETTNNNHITANHQDDGDKISSRQSQEESQSRIDLYEMDCQGVAFYDKLVKEWLPKLNYIVLATEDDELNMSHAVHIFQLAVRYNNDMQRLRIMVRVKHDESQHFKNIAEHYNRLWAAECESTDKYKRHQHVIEATKIVEGPITLFGLGINTYTFNNIVEESAKAFKEKYDLSLSELLLSNGQITNPFHFNSWEEERNAAMQLTGDYEGFSPTYSSMMRLRRVQNQNVANALHAATKIMLAKCALKSEYDLIKVHGLLRKVNEIVYQWRDHSNDPIDHIQRVMDVLAQTEHLRWVASHEILGYIKHPIHEPTDPGKRDEAKLLHDYLCDWDDLIPETKSYDYNAVDVSINEYGYE